MCIVISHIRTIPYFNGYVSSHSETDGFRADGGQLSKIFPETFFSCVIQLVLEVPTTMKSHCRDMNKIEPQMAEKDLRDSHSWPYSLTFETRFRFPVPNLFTLFVKGLQTIIHRFLFSCDLGSHSSTILSNYDDSNRIKSKISNNLLRSIDADSYGNNNNYSCH